MKKIKSTGIYFFMLILLVFIDQFTKYQAVYRLKENEDYILIPNILRFHYLENKGAAWGMLQGHTWLFVLITVIVLIVLVATFIKLPITKRFIPLKIALTFVAAGAIGNFIDRLLNQYVVDFIYFELIDFPIFNVADIYVCISAVFLLYLLIFFYKEEDLSWKDK